MSKRNYKSKTITMKNLLIFIVLLSTITLSAQNVDEDKEAIKKVIQTAYVDGLQNEGDIEKIDAGIHPDFNLLGIEEGEKMWAYSITDWKASVLKKKEAGKYPKTGDDLVTVKFPYIDVTGTAAMVKIEFYVGEKLTYVDYIALYKFDNKWKMVNKIFYKF